MVMADRLRLEQVIINLLRNALDATKEAKDPQIDREIPYSQLRNIAMPKAPTR